MTKDKFKEETIKKNKRIKSLIVSFIILFICSLVTLYIINLNGIYPWGSDTFSHLYKAEILHDSLKSGKLFLNYEPNWYNGIQPFRYWAPMTYYILAIINLFINNIFITFNIFILFVFIVGGTGFILWGYFLKRQYLGLIFGIMWFFVPDNLRILFSEGNIPVVMVNILIPFVFLFYYKSIVENKKKNYFALSILMAIVTLNHARLSVMIWVGLFIFAIVDSILNKRVAKNCSILIVTFLGIMLSAFWLVPASSGGIIEMEKEAILERMRGLSYPLSHSLNPMTRLNNKEAYYFGASFAMIAIFGIAFSYRREKVGFISGLIVLLGTTTAALPLLKDMPLNKIFGMSRLTTIALGMIVVSILLWKNLKKIILAIFVLLLALDSTVSFNILGFNTGYPSELANILDIASNVATQRIAILDNSQYGSFPSYYLSYNDKSNVKAQTYGGAGQRVSTEKNIVKINNAIEKNYFLIMFDRSLELGADTLVVKKDVIKRYDELEEASSYAGYEKYYENDDAIIYKLPIDHKYGVKVEYEGLAIGKYSINIIYKFPNFIRGESQYIDDYTVEELSKYKSVFLSGFKFRDKKNAERIVTEAAKLGVKILIDSTGIDYKGFLGKVPQDIMLKNNYGEVLFNGEKVILEPFPEGISDFKSTFFSGNSLSDNKNYTLIENHVIEFLSYNEDNIGFIGLNIPYFMTMTNSYNATKIMESALGMESGVLPKRDIVKLDIDIIDDEIKIYSDEEDVVTSIAAIDVLNNIEGNFSVVNNLVKIEDKEVTLKVGYPPNILLGVKISVLSLIMIIIISRLLNKTRYVLDERSDMING